MDSKHAEPASSAPLKYQTWFLKVSIHCEGCSRKVKKVLQSIDGVFTTTIDQQQQKVTVTGCVAVETLLRKLVRAGKHAEIWPENVAAGNGKISGKPKNKSSNKEKDTESLKNNSSVQKQSSESKASSNNKKESKSSNSKTSESSPEKSTAGDNASPENHNGGGGGGGGSVVKKKKKGHSGGNVRNSSSSAPAHTGFQLQNERQDVAKEMGQMNLSPTRQQQQQYLYPSESNYPPMVYVAAAYNRLYPMGSMGGPYYYVPPSPSLPYTCAGIDQDSYYYYYQFQSKPLVSFEIFSDENANGCCVM